jgi:hypothetical protein
MVKINLPVLLFPLISELGCALVCKMTYPALLQVLLSVRAVLSITIRLCKIEFVFTEKVITKECRNH